MIVELLEGKNASERAEIKARAFEDIDAKGKWHDDVYGLDVEILSLTKIDKGIALFVRAWKDNEQLGFGKDGTIEIERIRIFNPPILVQDGNGKDVLRRRKSSVDGVTRTKKYREDLLGAIRLDVAHTVHLIAKSGENIVNGKVGNTTSTFYPDANVETTSVDGFVALAGQSSWSAARDAADGSAASDTATNDSVGYVRQGATTYACNRGFFLFDTSSIPDTDSISAATLSIYGLASDTIDAINDASSYINVVSSSPASNTALTTADFDQFGTTVFSTSIDITSWSTTGYNDFALNASGIANITKTGVSKFCSREGHDIDNVDPGGSGGLFSSAGGYYADQAGTTNDPKLVVTHAAAAATARIPTLLLMGVG